LQTTTADFETMTYLIDWMMKLSLQMRDLMPCGTDYHHQEEELVLDNVDMDHFDDAKTWSSNLWIGGTTQKLDFKDDGTVATVPSSISSFFSGVEQ